MLSNSFSFATQPYKGTRDFYPDLNQFNSPAKDVQDFRKRQYIFETWRTTLLKCGFLEYDCSVIEQAEIYLAKSGEELGSKQLYSFQDKGERHIALRPEMTPSLARMVADKYSELRFPLRWFSIPNCFRYEQPQKGRLREHWQVNADILGLEAGASDVELFLILPKLFEAFGAKNEDFVIYYNHRQTMDWFLQEFLEIKENLVEIIKVIDDWRKFKRAENEQFLSKYLPAEKIQKIADLCTDFQSESYQIYLKEAEKNEEIQILNSLVNQLYPDFEIKFNPAIIRGQAYYTGLVFEAFDGNQTNPRSLVGGGRYDNLMSLFDKPKVPAVGFGSGDVTWLEFLQNWNLLEGNENYETWLANYQPQKVGIMPIVSKNEERKVEEKSFTAQNTELASLQQITKIIQKKMVNQKEKRPLIVAIDGRGGSGKTTLGHELEKILPNSRHLNLDDYTERGGDFFTPELVESGWEVDFENTEYLVGKLKEEIAENSWEIVFLVGSFSFKNLQEIDFDLKIWLELDKETAAKRLNNREAKERRKIALEKIQLSTKKWQESEDRYLANFQPSARADLIISTQNGAWEIVEKGNYLGQKENKFNLIFDLYGVLIEGYRVNSLIAKTVNFIQKNREKYNFYYLSNISQEQLERFQKDEVFNVFQGGLGSFHSQFAKPEKEFFQEFLQKYNLAPENCLFIDDSSQNVKSAEGLGISGLVFTIDYTDVEKEIEQKLELKRQELTENNLPQVEKKNEPESELAAILTKIYTEVIPQLQKEGKSWDIDYAVERSEKKRWETLKKRGCGDVLKIF